MLFGYVIAVARFASPNSRSPPIMLQGLLRSATHHDIAVRDLVVQGLLVPRPAGHQEADKEDQCGQEFQQIAADRSRNSQARAAFIDDLHPERELSDRSLLAACFHQ